MAHHEITESDDIIDVRDVITRLEELRIECSPDEEAEMTDLESLLEDLKGNGGDEQWEGDWYPITLIRDSYFEDHARDLAEDCGMIPSDATWPCTCIDWEQAASELQMDYSSVEFRGVTYWYR